MEQDQKYSFGVFLKESQELIGLLSLTEIVRGPLSFMLAWILFRSGA